MQKHHVTWAGYGAILAGLAAIDAGLGIGAMQALADLCLSDGDAPVDMAQMPMDHRGHLLPWLALSAALGAIHQLGHWHLAKETARNAWSPARRPILAGLARIAQAQNTPDAQALVDAYNAQLQPGISLQDAQIALARFGAAPASETHALLNWLTDDTLRAAFLNASVALLRGPGRSTPKAMVELERLTAAMGMTGLEICAHWDQTREQGRAALAAHGAQNLVRVATGRILAPLNGALSAIAFLPGPSLPRLGRGLRYLARGAGHAFIRAVAPPARPAGDDQLAALRRRFKRRRVPTSLSDLSLHTRLPFRRGLS